MKLPGIGPVATWLTGASPPMTASPTTSPGTSQDARTHATGARTRGPIPVASPAAQSPQAEQPTPGSTFAGIAAAFALPAQLTAATFRATMLLMSAKPELAVPELSRQIADFSANVESIVDATTGPVDMTRQDDVARFARPLIALNEPAKRFASSIDLTRSTDAGYDQATMETAAETYVRATDRLHARMLATQGPDSQFTFFASTLRGSARASYGYAQQRLDLLETVSQEKSGILRRMDAAGPWP